MQQNVGTVLRDQKGMVDAISCIRNRVVHLQHELSKSAKSRRVAEERIFKVLSRKVEGFKKGQEKLKHEAAKLRKRNQVWYRNFLHRKASQTEIENTRHEMLEVRRQNVASMRKMILSNREFVRRREEELLRQRRLKREEWQAHLSASQESRNKVRLSQSNEQKVRDFKAELKAGMSVRMKRMKQELRSLTDKEKLLLQLLAEGDSQEQQLQFKLKEVQRMKMKDVIARFNELRTKFGTAE